MAVTTPAMKTLSRAATGLLATAGPALAQVTPLRKFVVSRAERELYDAFRENQLSGADCPGVADDKTAIGLAILRSVERGLVEKRVSRETIQCAVKTLVQGLIFEQGEQSAQERFMAEHVIRPPTFLLISPTKACNLRCVGCYADSGGTTETLPWETFDRIVEDAKTLWGVRFFVLSGGEPFSYRSEGKGVVDMAEKHNDCFFMAYTNGTLINDAMADRLARAGNFWPAISVEGWRERTDARRGAGIYDKVLATMARLRAAKAAFGISLTATRHNAEEILSDEFVNFFFEEQGALFGWIFHYLPIGRAFTLDLMPTPEQRMWMWRRTWEHIRNDRRFLIDFWNHGTVCDGCISAGGHGKGGYMYVDWNGAVSPCVFLPYSPLKAQDVFARGGTMTDVWADPFFGAVRQWQTDFQVANRNEIAPCPMRDHHTELRRLLNEYEPDPLDENAQQALLDPEYAAGMADYDRRFGELADPIWQSYYNRPVDPTNGRHLAPLPDLASKP